MNQKFRAHFFLMGDNRLIKPLMRALAENEKSSNNNCIFIQLTNKIHDIYPVYKSVSRS